jgi:hypothetical protein
MSRDIWIYLETFFHCLKTKQNVSRQIICRETKSRFISRHFLSQDNCPIYLETIAQFISRQMVKRHQNHIFYVAVVKKCSAATKAAMVENKHNNTAAKCTIRYVLSLNYEKRSHKPLQNHACASPYFVKRCLHVLWSSSGAHSIFQGGSVLCSWIAVMALGLWDLVWLFRHALGTLGPQSDICPVDFLPSTHSSKLCCRAFCHKMVHWSRWFVINECPRQFCTSRQHGQTFLNRALVNFHREMLPLPSLTVRPVNCRKQSSRGIASVIWIHNDFFAFNAAIKSTQNQHASLTK